MTTSPLPRLGVAICSFASADVILDCLESLLASKGVALSIVVADNASPDETIAVLRHWAHDRSRYRWPEDVSLPCPARTPAVPVPLDGGAIADLPHRVTLIETGVNGGFAAGVNAALAVLLQDPGLERFWILNPDSLVTPDAARAFATQPVPPGGFSLMGGRVLYCDGTEQIQIDGGTINWRTGVTGNIGLGAPHATTPPPPLERLEFITGASVVVSRQFCTQAGPMPEDYFLYYEEVDWAQRRGDLPLVYCREGIVYHRAGTAIGSPTLGRPASPFSLYFKHRARILFLRRHRPRSLPLALAYSAAKATQLLFKGYPREAMTLLWASLGGGPPAIVRQRLSPAALARLAAVSRSA